MATEKTETAENDGVAPGGSVYDAFISYSHAADDLLAPRLQTALQRFAKPWWKRRALRIFRDESSLSANPHLWSSITNALDQSGWFVLLLSPDASASPWVNNEIEYWLEHQDPDRIIPVLTDGDFTWSGDDFVSDAAPPALQGAFGDEPRWVDLRFAATDEQLDLQNPQFSAAVADIASAIRGVPKDELESEEVRQHRRTVRTAWGAGIALLILVVLASATAIYAVGQQNRANDLAQSESAARQDAVAAADAEAAARDLADANAAEATSNAAVARSRELAASAVNVLEEDAELSILLALESIEATPPEAAASPVGVLALREGLQQHRLLNRFTGVGDSVYARISADGSTIYVSSEADRSVTALDSSSGAVVWTYHDPTTIDGFADLVVSPDDSLVAVEISDLSVCHLCDGFEIGKPAVSDDSVAVDEQGNDAHPSRVVVLDAETGDVLEVLVPGACPVNTLQGFAANGRWLVVSTGTEACFSPNPDATYVTLFDTATWEAAGPQLQIDGFIGEAATFSADGSRVLIHDTFRTGVSELRSYPELELINQLPPSSVAILDPTGEVAVINAQDRSTRRQLLVRADTGERISHLELDDFLTGDGVRFSPDGSVVVVSTRSHDYVFDATSGELLVDLGNTGATGSLSFTADGSTLATTHLAQVRIWDLAGSAAGTETPLAVQGPPAKWINPDQVVDGNQLAVRVIVTDGPTGGEDATVTLILDPDTGSTIQQIVGDSAQLADGRFVVAQRSLGTEDRLIGPLVVLDPVSGEVTELDRCVAALDDLVSFADIDCASPFFSWTEYDRNPIVVSADGSSFVASSYAPAPFTPEGSVRTARVWDAATLEVRSEFEIADGPVRAAGTTWLAAEGDPLVIYDVDSGAVVAELEIDSEIIAMTATSDGSLLFVGDGAGLLRVFDTTTWEPIAVWQAHEAFLRGLAVSPDAARLVTTGHDNLVKVWDITGLAASGSLAGPPPLLDRIPGYFASDAAWLSPDRLAVFLATDAGYLVVSLSVDELATEAAQRLTRSFTVGECLTYQIDPCPTLEEIRRR